MVRRRNLAPEFSLSRFLAASLTGTVIWLSLQVAPVTHFTPRTLDISPEAARLTSLSVSETSSTAADLAPARRILEP
jgi:hypothetical protein